MGLWFSKRESLDFTILPSEEISGPLGLGNVYTLICLWVYLASNNSLTSTIFHLLFRWLSIKIISLAWCSCASSKRMDKFVKFHCMFDRIQTNQCRCPTVVCFAVHNKWNNNIVLAIVIINSITIVFYTTAAATQQVDCVGTLTTIISLIKQAWNGKGMSA